MTPTTGSESTAEATSAAPPPPRKLITNPAFELFGRDLRARRASRAGWAVAPGLNRAWPKRGVSAARSGCSAGEAERRPSSYHETAWARSAAAKARSPNHWQGGRQPPRAVLQRQCLDSGRVALGQGLLDLELVGRSDLAVHGLAESPMFEHQQPQRDAEGNEKLVVVGCRNKALVVRWDAGNQSPGRVGILLAFQGGQQLGEDIARRPVQRRSHPRVISIAARPFLRPFFTGRTLNACSNPSSCGPTCQPPTGPPSRVGGPPEL